MLRQCSRTIARATRCASGVAAKRLAPSTTSAQRAGFATIYDNRTPFEDVNRHRSDAEMRIAEVPIIEVDGHAAVCDGGGGALGHPVEYIQLDTRVHNTPQTCKYCGLRYRMKPGAHGHHH